MDNGQLIGAIVGSTLGAVILTALVAWCCCMCMRNGSGMSPGPVNNFNPVGSYQMPPAQQKPWFSSYGNMQGGCDQGCVQPQRAQSFFQQSPFTDYARRYDPNYSFGGQ